MTPLFLSIILDRSGPTDSHISFLTHLPGLVRVRIVPKNDTPLFSWLKLFESKRVSVDANAHIIRRMAEDFGIEQYLHQVRIPVGSSPEETFELVQYIRSKTYRLAIVLLLPIEALSHSFADWLQIFQWPRVFINLIPAHNSGCVLKAHSFLSWRSRFGKRLFISIPPLAAEANDEAAGPCPTQLGMHIVLDIKNNSIRVCDCFESPVIPLDDKGYWLDEWRRQVIDIQTMSYNACKGCLLWTKCRGGCLTPRLDGIRRDRYCPWPDRIFEDNI